MEPQLPRVKASGLKGAVKQQVKDKVIEALESTDLLDDNDLKSILESLINVGWKQNDGNWRKL